VYRLRVLGKTIFLILRDCSGQVQCVASSEALKDLRLKPSAQKARPTASIFFFAE
jgi:hypothetical protein